MKQYDEKLKQLQKEDVPITTKWLRKTLCNILRQHSDIMTDNETTSSMGSDKAPSEDNFDFEQIKQVIPTNSDDEETEKKDKNLVP